MNKQQTHTVSTQFEMAKRCLKHREVDVRDLSRIGEVIIHDIGQENIYFTSVWFGTEHFCKVN